MPAANTLPWLVLYEMHDKSISPNVAVKNYKWTFNYPCTNGADPKCSFYDVHLTPGIWYLEAIGASGGDLIKYTGLGGRGSRVHGILRLNTAQSFQFRIGGEGNSYVGDSGLKSLGGYNGGGSTPGGASGGGGSSDIRLDDSLQSRIMVSAGGGGANDNNNGGDGGELIGYSRGGPNDGRPGNQTHGGDGFPAGSFGFGGSCLTGYEGGGGGGGFFGGGKGNFVAASSESVGGGGSSYVSGYFGCNSVDKNGVSTGKAVHYSGLKFSDPKMEGRVNKGHGKIILRLIRPETNENRIFKRAQLLSIQQ